MANDATAPAQPAGTPSEDEYQTFSAALSASARGRAFLAEYARRHRGADTETLLAGLARLETLVRARPAADPARPELRRLLATLRAARPELEQSALPARAAKLAVLLDLLERRLAALAEPASAPELAPAQLAVVPPPDEPELPIPTPAAAQPALTIAHERAPPPLPAGASPEPASSAAIIPEVNWFDNTAPVAAAAEIASALPALKVAPERVLLRSADEPSAGAVVSPPPFGEGSGVGVSVEGAPPASRATPLARPPRQGGREHAEPAARPEPTSAQQTPTAAHEPAASAPQPDPLAALMALSEEERIALFT